MSRPTSIPRRLTPPEFAAIQHLLARSALADCQGTLGRVSLSDEGDLVIRDLAGWRWSSGETVLLDVLRFVVGDDVRWPDLNKLDDHNQQVVREAIRMLAEGEARRDARFVRAVETS